MTDFPHWIEEANTRYIIYTKNRVVDRNSHYFRFSFSYRGTYIEIWCNGEDQICNGNRWWIRIAKDLAKEKLSNENLTIGGSTNGNGNKDTNSCITRVDGIPLIIPDPSQSEDGADEVCGKCRRRTDWGRYHQRWRKSDYCKWLNSLPFLWSGIKLKLLWMPCNENKSAALIHLCVLLLLTCLFSIHT